MSDFRFSTGFDEVWRPPVRSRKVRPESVLKAGAPQGEMRAKLARVAKRTPEVMVKVTGRTRGLQHLQAHLEYIMRRGELEAEGREGWPVLGEHEVRELARDWEAAAAFDGRRGARTPTSHSIVLSMPAQTDPLVLRDAARAFAAETFAERHDFVFVLHTDAGHPHVHLAVRSLGDNGERLNPKKADLEAWRQTFARCLRERGIEAEATPRRARGVTRKPERTAVRKLRERLGADGRPRVVVGAYKEAAQAAFGKVEAKPWDIATARRQAQTRARYLAEARLLMASTDEADRALGREVEAFVRGMPQPDTQRLALARELRAANERAGTARQGQDKPPPGRSR